MSSQVRGNHVQPVYSKFLVISSHNHQVTVGAFTLTNQLLPWEWLLVLLLPAKLAYHEGNGSQGTTQFSYQAMGWMIWGFIPDRWKEFFSYPKHPDQAWDPPSLIMCNGYCGSIPRKRRQGHDGDCSPPTKVEVRNEWTSTPSIHLHGMQRHNFAFTLTDSSTTSRNHIVLALQPQTVCLTAHLWCS